MIIKSCLASEAIFNYFALKRKDSRKWYQKIVKYGLRLGFLCINNHSIGENISLKFKKRKVILNWNPGCSTSVKIQIKWFDKFSWVPDTSVTNKKVEHAEFSQTMMFNEKRSEKKVN